MKLSTAMSYVVECAKIETDITQCEKTCQEHLLIGLFKAVESTAEKVSQNSKDTAETIRELAVLRRRFLTMRIDTKSARAFLRFVMIRERGIYPRDEVLAEETLYNAAIRLERNTLSTDDVLTAILEKPTIRTQVALNLRKREDSVEEEERISEAYIRRDNLLLLSEQTRYICKVRDTLLKKVRGQNHAVHAFIEGMFLAESMAADEGRRRPSAIFVFAGPPGVGKTFLAEQAAEELAIPYRRFDMSAFSDHQASNLLIGFSSAYRNAVKGLLTSFVKENPHCMLLFDEIEKAHLNVIQLFLQILDAGRLHDDFLNEDISFRDAIIIFTTNAGRQLYEDGQFNAAGLSRRTILNALETDAGPVAGSPFFPSAICSRLGTGCLLMFNRLAVSDLEDIASDALTRLCGLFERKYGIRAEYDDLLPSVLLLTEGGRGDARTLTAQCISFFQNEIYKICSLLVKRIEGVLTKLKRIRFTVRIGNSPKDVRALFKSRTKPEFLIFGDTRLAASLQKSEAGLITHWTPYREKAFSLLSEHDIGFVLLKVVSDDLECLEPEDKEKPHKKPGYASFGVADSQFFDDRLGGSVLLESWIFFKELRERMPEIPIYLLEIEGFAIDEELENAFIRAGARGKLAVSGTSIDICAKDLLNIARRLHLQTMAESLAAERKILSFETIPVKTGESLVTVFLHSLTQRRAPDAGDISSVLSEADKPKIRFADVFGAQNAKEALGGVVQYLKNPKSFTARGVHPPKGVLLYGQPGTGKTMLAKALAGESDAAFITTVASSFVSNLAGSGPKAVRELFSRARRYAPSIVFIDEIDAIGRARGSNNTGHAEEMTLNALLEEMDGFKTNPKKPVVVLAATNFDVDKSKSGPGFIEPALVRRFDRTILVGLPAKEDRRLYLEYSLGKVKACNASSAIIERLAERSVNFTLANLESVLKLAETNSIKLNKPLDGEILEDAFELFRFGEQQDFGPEYLERMAYHEAGHALIGYLRGCTPSYLTIISRGRYGGYSESIDTKSCPSYTREELLARIRTCLGGRAAELAFYGDEKGFSSGVSSDLETATIIAKAMITRYGMDADFGLAVVSDNEAENAMTTVIHSKINAILKEQMDKTIAIIRDNREKIDNLTKALLEKSKMTGEEIEVLLLDER